MRVILPIVLSLWPAMVPAGEPFALDVTLGTGKKEVQLTMPTNRMVQITVVKLTTDAPAAAMLHVTPFRSERHEPVLIAALDPTNLVFESNQVFATVMLQVPPMRTLTKYSGTLGLTANGIAPILWNVTLSPPDAGHPATLVVIPNARKWSIIKDFLYCRDADSPQVTLTLKDKGARWPLEGIGVTLGAVTAPDRANFDLAKNASFFLEGKKIPGFAASGANGTNLYLRSTAPGESAVLGLALHDLAAGQYTMELNFSALNSQEDPQQKVMLTIQAGDSIWRAGLFLFLAMIVSFFAYKGLRLYQERIELRGRIRKLRPGWLFYRDPIYAVVWVRTMLKQAEELIRRLWLVSAVIGEGLDKVPPVVEALNEAGKAEEQLGALPPLVRNRIKGVMAGAVRNLSDHNMDKAVADRARIDLASLNSELASDKWQARYRTEVEGAVKAFRFGFDLAAFPPMETAERTKVEDALKTLDKGIPAGASVQDIMDYEEIYAKLKLLDEWRNYSDVFKPVLAHFNEPVLDKIFAFVDTKTWERIKASKDNGLMIHPPTEDGPEPLEPFRPLKFYVSTGDKHLDNTYLFNRGLHFDWTFKLQPHRPSWRKQAEPIKSQAKTHSPRVAQFASDRGVWTASVEINCYIQDPGKTPIREKVSTSAPPLTISKSSEIRLLIGLDRVELWTFLVAYLFALATGLATFYYKNPTFGSLQDYIGLFLWGATIDQTKNFVRDLRASQRDATG